MNNYSDYFKTLHDELKPTGHFGRGTHYSVLRAMSWHDQFMQSLPSAYFLDFSIVWDEDHDERVLHAISRMYVQNLLSPVIFIGERKGSLTVVLSDLAYQAFQKSGYLKNYEKLVADLSAGLEDSWNSEVVCLSSVNNPIVAATDHDLDLYLRNINMLWKLGIKSTIS